MSVYCSGSSITHMLMKCDNHVFLGVTAFGHPVILQFLEHVRHGKKTIFFGSPREKVKASHGTWRWAEKFGEPLTSGINWWSV